MKRKGIGISIDLIVTLVIAIIVILVSAFMYDSGSNHLAEFAEQNLNFVIGGGE